MCGSRTTAIDTGGKNANKNDDVEENLEIRSYGANLRWIFWLTRIVNNWYFI